MGSPQTKVWEEIQQGFAKILIWIFYISIGVIAKLAFDSRVHKLSWRQIAIKTILSIFVGVMVAMVCEKQGYVTWEKVVVPVSTLMGEGIVVYFMTHWKRILVNWAPAWVQKIFKK